MSEIQKKVTKEEFIEAIINNTDNKSNAQLADELGISHRHFYRLQEEYAIRSKDEVKKYAQRFTSEMVQLLRKNANKGSDRAIQLLLEIGEAYTPSNKLDVKGTMSIEYSVGQIRTPIDAGLSPGKQVKSSEQKQVKVVNKQRILTLHKHNA